MFLALYLQKPDNYPCLKQGCRRLYIQLRIKIPVDINCQIRFRSVRCSVMTNPGVWVPAAQVIPESAMYTFGTLTSRFPGFDSHGPIISTMYIHANLKSKFKYTWIILFSHLANICKHCYSLPYASIYCIKEYLKT